MSTLSFTVLPGSPPAPFEFDGLTIQPLHVQHGFRQNNNEPFYALGFRIGPIAYISDACDIPPTTLALLRSTEILVIDALRRTPHPSHFSLYEAIDVARAVAPKYTLLTGLCHRLDHQEVISECKKVELQLGAPDTTLPLCGSPGHAITGGLWPKQLRTAHYVQEDDVNGRPLWIRPAFDGMRITLPVDQTTMGRLEEQWI